MNSVYEESKVFYRLSDFSPLFEGVDMLFYGKGMLSSNVYILEEGRTLIDTGNTVFLVDDITDNLGGICVERVIITHAHPDHIGGLFTLLSKTKPLVYIHEVEASVKLYGEPLMDIFKRIGINTVLLKGNEDIELSDRILRVLYAPGHTPGSIMLYDTKSGILFSSDVLFPVIGERVLLTQPDPISGNLNELILSVRFLLRLAPKAFLPGHLFPVWEKPLDHVKKTYFELKLQEEKDQKLALISLGINLADIGEIDEAITLFDMVLKEEPEHPGALFVKALALYQKGMIEESLEILDGLERLYPDFQEAKSVKETIKRLRI